MRELVLLGGSGGCQREEELRDGGVVVVSDDVDGGRGVLLLAGLFGGWLREKTRDRESE